jgi:glucosylceramidase
LRRCATANADRLTEWISQVDYTIEYYTTEHLTKFVRPGAVRIDSTADNTIWNVASNSDGSKALIAYNNSSSQTIKVVWGAQSFLYSLPIRTSATFTWNGNPTT